MNLNPCVKGYGHFCQILALFMMLTHQIWSYHVTQNANFENVSLYPNSTFNIRKVTNFPVEKLSISEVISKRPHGGWKTPPPPPSAFNRVKRGFSNEQLNQLGMSQGSWIGGQSSRKRLAGCQGPWPVIKKKWPPKNGYLQTMVFFDKK